MGKLNRIGNFNIGHISSSKCRKIKATSSLFLFHPPSSTLATPLKSPSAPHFLLFFNIKDQSACSDSFLPSNKMIIDDTGPCLKLNVLNSRIICLDDLFRFTNYVPWQDDAVIAWRESNSRFVINNTIRDFIRVDGRRRPNHPPGRTQLR